MVRIDFFKESGKWYTTIAIKFDNYHTEDEHIRDTFDRCIKEQVKGLKGMTAVCLDPYHEHSHPLLTKVV